MAGHRATAQLHSNLVFSCRTRLHVNTYGKHSAHSARCTPRTFPNHPSSSSRRVATAPLRSLWHSLSVPVRLSISLPHAQSVSSEVLALATAISQHYILPATTNTGRPQPASQPSFPQSRRDTIPPLLLRAIADFMTIQIGFLIATVLGINGQRATSLSAANRSGRSPINQPPFRLPVAAPIEKPFPGALPKPVTIRINR